MGDSLVWVDVPCPLCGARRDDPLLMVPTSHGMCRLARCADCDMVYLNPRPDDACLPQLYPADYHAYQPPATVREGPWHRLLRRVRRLALSRYYGYPPELSTGLERALAPLGKAMLDLQGNSMTHLEWVGDGRLLDYGCGSGWFAARMRDRGWRVTVMDFNADSLALASKRYDLPAVPGSLPNPRVAAGSFDVITLGSVLEHVPNPHRLIEGAARALTADGLLVVSVPCISSWGFRTFGPNWFGLDLPRHLLHFTPLTLRKLLEQHGLQVRECRMVARGSWLRGTLRTAGPELGPLKRLLCRAAAWTPITRLLGRWSAETRQADTFKVVAVKPARCAPALRLAA
jgi:2-polyprenyl-3-methyl-5-hydroxy-6-metoxy-1,4-benzoquinol methylase